MVGPAAKFLGHAGRKFRVRLAAFAKGCPLVSYTMFLKKIKFAKDKKFNTYDNYVTLSKENATQIWYKEYKLFEKGNFARMQFRLLNREQRNRNNSKHCSNFYSTPILINRKCLLRL